MDKSLADLVAAQIADIIAAQPRAKNFVFETGNETLVMDDDGNWITTSYSRKLSFDSEA